MVDIGNYNHSCLWTNGPNSLATVILGKLGVFVISHCKEIKRKRRRDHVPNATSMASFFLLSVVVSVSCFILSIMILSVGFLLYTAGLGNPLTSKFNSEKINFRGHVHPCSVFGILCSAYVADVIVDLDVKQKKSKLYISLVESKIRIG